MNYKVLIQGPLNKTSLSNLDYYRQFGDIVISFWDSDDKSLLDNVDLTNVQLISQPLPQKTILQNIRGHNTFIYHVYSVLKGLELINSKYVIRTRSDERYGNLIPLLNKFESNQNKEVVCANIFFKKWSWRPCHMGDHLYICRTSLLRDAFEYIINNHDKFHGVDPETAIAWAILDTLGLPRIKHNFVQTFDVIDTNLLAPFVARWHHANITYIDKFYNDDIITNMSEL